MVKRPCFDRRRRRNDAILILVVLALVAIGITYLFLFREPGAFVKVTIDGQLYGEYPLSENRVEIISAGSNADQRNVLVIYEGKAFVKEANCPDGICSDHRAVFRDGESIICLPHRVVITVVSEQTKSNLDAIA